MNHALQTPIQILKRTSLRSSTAIQSRGNKTNQSVDENTELAADW